MSLFGYSLSEWATLIGLIGSLLTVFVWTFKKLVLNTFYDKLKSQEESAKRRDDQMNRNLESLLSTINKLNEAFSSVDKRLDEHDRRLDRHHEKIKTLYNRGK